MQLDFLNIYALCKLLCWQKPLTFNSWRILYCSLEECDIASMSIIICFVFTKFVIGLVLMWSTESNL